MVFYIYTNDGWIELEDSSDVIFRRGINQWYPVDFTQQKVFHQQIGSQWQAITQKEQALYRPSYYY